MESHRTAALVVLALAVGSIGTTGIAVAVDAGGSDTAGPAPPSGSTIPGTPVPLDNATDTDPPTSPSTVVDSTTVDGDLETATPIDANVTDGLAAAESPTAGTGVLADTLSNATALDGELADGLESGIVLEATATASPAPTPESPANGSAPAGATGPIRRGGDADGGTELPPGAGDIALVGGAAVAAGVTGRAVLIGTEVPGVTDAAARSRSAIGRGVGAWADRLGRVLGLFGYQRYDDSDPLEHGGRAALYDQVRANPGIHLSAVSEAADLPLSTARYHLRVLEHEGLVHTAKLGGKRRHFPPDVEAEALTVALAEDATGTVLRSLVRAGPASVTRLAVRLDRDPSTLSPLLDRLEEDGLVDRERRGRAVVSTARPAVERAVTRMQAGEPPTPRGRPVATSD